MRNARLEPSVSFLVMQALACVAALPLAQQPAYAQASDRLAPSGVFARDRAITGGLQFFEESAAIGFDAVEYMQQRREAGNKQAAGGVAREFGIYDAKVAQNGLELQVWRGVSLVQKSAFSIGGPVGMAMAGVWTVTMDRMMEQTISKKNDLALTLLKANLRNLNQTAFDDFIQEVQSGSPATTSLQDYFKATIDAADSSDPAANEVSAKELDLLARKLNEATFREVYELSQASQESDAEISEKIKGTQTELKTLNSQIKVLGTRMDSVQADIDRVKQGVDQLTFEQLNAEDKKRFLLDGGLAHLDPEARDRLLQFAESQIRQARVAAVGRALEASGAAAQALSSFARNALKDEQAARLFDDAAKAVFVAQSGLTIYAAFATGGSATAAWQAFGGLSSMTGGGGDALGGLRSELAAMAALLKEMNWKLDQIINMQTEALKSLDLVHYRLDRLQRDVNELRDQVDGGFTAVLQSNWKDIYIDCAQLAGNQGFQRPGNASWRIPFEDPAEYTRYHYLNKTRFDLLVDQGGSNCFKALTKLIDDPGQLVALGKGTVDPNGVSTSEDLRKTNERLDDLYEYTERYLARKPGTPEATQEKWFESLGFALRVPSADLASIRVRASDRLYQFTDNEAVPCWWIKVDDDVRCHWHRGFKDNGKLPLIARPYLHAWALMEVLDYILAFYPIGLLPTTWPDDPRELAALLDTQLSIESKANLVRNMLEEALRVTERGIFHESLLEGDFVALMVAQDLLAPPIRDADTVDKKQPLYDALPASCLERWANIPSGVAAPVNALLYKNPRIAELALRLIAHSSVFPDASQPMGLTERVAKYALARNADPQGLLLRYGYSTTSNVGPPAGKPAGDVTFAGDGLVDKWWEGIFNLTSTVKVVNGKSITHVGRGYQLHHAAVDGAKAKLSYVIRDPKVDSTKNQCNGFELVEGEIELPRGWSISAGGLVVRLPEAAALMAGSIEYGPRLRALISRRDALRNELTSLVVPSSVDDWSGLSALIQYDLAKKLAAFQGAAVK